MEKLKGWLQLAAVAGGLAASVYAGASAIWGDVAKTEDLVTHDLAGSAHPPLREAVERCEAKALAAQNRIEELRSDQVAIGGRIIRMVSADIERNAALRAARASYYEDQYRGLVQRGLPVEEAMLEALRTPWYSRPR